MHHYSPVGTITVRYASLQYCAVTAPTTLLSSLGILLRWNAVPGFLRREWGPTECASRPWQGDWERTSRVRGHPGTSHFHCFSVLCFLFFLSAEQPRLLVAVQIFPGTILLFVLSFIPPFSSPFHFYSDSRISGQPWRQRQTAAGAQRRALTPPATRGTPRAHRCPPTAQPWRLTPCPTLRRRRG